MPSWNAQDQLHLNTAYYRHVATVQCISSSYDWERGVPHLYSEWEVKPSVATQRINSIIKNFHFRQATRYFAVANILKTREIIQVVKFLPQNTNCCIVCWMS